MDGLSESRSNVCLAIRCKTRLIYTYFITSDSKLLCSKKTLVIRCYSSRLIVETVVQRNFRVRNDSAAGVAHNAFKSCSNSRRLSGSLPWANQQEKRGARETDGKPESS